jgi:hypothetical protein
LQNDKASLRICNIPSKNAAHANERKVEKSHDESN